MCGARGCGCRRGAGEVRERTPEAAWVARKGASRTNLEVKSTFTSLCAQAGILHLFTYQGEELKTITMGNDGGSIPTRRELVKEAARDKTTDQLRESQQEQQEHFWTTDPISNEPLEPPIVSDSNGRLYNKISVLGLLTGSETINKEEAEKVTQGAIKTLKDIVEVKFTEDADTETKRNANGARTHRWICPITNKPLGPGSKAVYLVPCGHAFSGATIKEVADEKCLQCQESYAPNDVIPIIPQHTDDIARLLLRSKKLKTDGLTHSLKKAGKKRKAKDGESEEKVAKVKSAKVAESGLRNSSTANVAAKVEEEMKAKKRKLDKNANLKSLFSTAERTVDLKNSKDFMSRGYSIPAHQK